MLILGLLGMYFDGEVVFVTSQTLSFRLALAILWLVCVCTRVWGFGCLYKSLIFFLARICCTIQIICVLLINQQGCRSQGCRGCNSPLRFWKELEQNRSLQLNCICRNHTQTLSGLIFQPLCVLPWKTIHGLHSLSFLSVTLWTFKLTAE
jgi:hypothetical protein